jgi:hypothetical protein
MIKFWVLIISIQNSCCEALFCSCFDFDILLVGSFTGMFWVPRHRFWGPRLSFKVMF